MMLRKSLHTLEGVLTEVGGKRFRPDGELLVEFLGYFVREFPATDRGAAKFSKISPRIYPISICRRPG